MKQSILVVFAVFLGSMVFGQLKNPVKWNFSAKKLDATTYELHLTATMDPGWHIYTVDHKGDIGVATTVSLKSNPLGTPQGKVKVVGKAVSKKDPSTGDMVRFYEGKVDLVQVVKLKSPVKTSFAGGVEFMACDDKQCLPPTTRDFKIAVE